MSNKDNNHIVDTNKKVSSVEWLKLKLITRQNTHIIHGEEVVFISLEKLNKLFEQAKAMHKEEIINTYQHGIKAGIGVAIDIEKGNDFSDLTPDEFYQQTYGEY